MQEHQKTKNGQNLNDETDEKSRTRIKNEDRELQRLGERLLTLSQEQLSAVDIPDELKDAVKEARNIKSLQAKSRQIQYIGVLMRSMDTGPVTRAFELIEAGVSLKRKKTSRSSEWLAALLGGDEKVIEDITRAFPDTDRQKLRQLTRNARKAAGTPAGSKPAKSLLRYLEELSVSGTANEKEIPS